MGNVMDKGMGLSRAFYIECGRPMLEEKFPRERLRIACGLVGEGSDAFGFDDDLSRDHDFGPGFSLWLTDEDAEKLGEELQEAYEGLPTVFRGIPKKVCRGMAAGRVGVARISDFYASYTGVPEGPSEARQWLQIPEQFLATATNGEVFADPLGEFTAIREKLLAFYPEDVRLKKLSSSCHAMGQSGQYNYPRALKRGDSVAALLALSQFTEAAMKAIYLLNRKYAPYYKWTFRGISQLTKLTEIALPLRTLCETPYREENIGLIEDICIEIRIELERQRLTKIKSDFLCDQSFSLLDEIEDAYIAGLPVTVG